MICTWHGKPSDQFAPGTESHLDALDVYLHVQPFLKTHVLLRRMMGRQHMMVTAAVCIDRPVIRHSKQPETFACHPGPKSGIDCFI